MGSGASTGPPIRGRRAGARRRVGWIGSLLAALVAGDIGLGHAQPPGGPPPPPPGAQSPGGKQGLRGMSPPERQRVLEDFQRWNELPEARRRELQDAYQRFQQLPPERRDQIMNRFRQFQALPPEQQERIIENQERWRRLPPEERQRIRERFEQMTPEERQKVRERLRGIPPPSDAPGGAQGFQGGPTPRRAPRPGPTP